MLGIRLYQGASIDLYVGDPTLFVCDALGNDASALERAAEQNLRHVTLHDVPVHIFNVIKTFLDHRQNRCPERITIALPSREDYQQFQVALFDTFPEEM